MKYRIFLVLLAFALTTSIPWADEWQPLEPGGNIPAPRSGHSLVFISNKAYLFGGLGDSRGYFHTIHTFDPRNREWYEEEPENTPPPARFGHRAVAYNNKMYVFFGCGDAGLLNDCWSYDPQTKLWAPLPGGQNTPPARAFHSVTLVGTKVWIFGGYDSNNQCLGDLYSYDFNGRTWEQHQVNSSGVRFGHSATANQDSLIFYGGYNDNYVTYDIWQYIIASNTWRQLIPLKEPKSTWPDPLAFHASATYDNKMWIMGGGSLDNPNYKTFELDITTMQWEQKSDGPAVFDAAAVLLESSVLPEQSTATEKSKVLIFGGTVNGVPSNTTWQYTTDSDSNPPPQPVENEINAKIGALGKASFALYVLKFEQDQDKVKVDVKWAQEQAKLKLYTLRIPCHHLANHPLSKIEDNWDRIGLGHLMHFNEEKNRQLATRGQQTISVTLSNVRRGYLLLLVAHKYFSKTARDIEFNVSEFKELPRMIHHVFFIGDPDGKGQEQTTLVKLPVTPERWHSRYPPGTDGDEIFGNDQESWQWQFKDHTRRLKFLPACVRFELP